MKFRGVRPVFVRTISDAYIPIVIGNIQHAVRMFLMSALCAVMHISIPYGNLQLVATVERLLSF